MFFLCLTAKGASIDGDSINTYSIVNESLLSIADSLNSESPGNIYYAFAFTECEDRLFLVVLHVEDENDIIDIVDNNSDYYRLMGCLLDYHNIFLLGHNVDENKWKDIINLSDIKTCLRRSVRNNSPTMFVYKENIAFEYVNGGFSPIVMNKE